MKLKDQSKELEHLIDMTTPDNVAGVSTDALPDELQAEPVFTVDYNKEMRECIKKARKSIHAILSSIIPKSFIQDRYVQDKVNQDAESLGKLYYQLFLIETVQKANVDSIGSGNVSPRMIEVFNQTSKSHTDIIDQINKLQTLFRKSYIDMVLDIKEKLKEEDTTKALISGPSETKKLTSGDDKYQRVFVGSKDLLEALNAKKKAKALGSNKLEDSEIEEV